MLHRDIKSENVLLKDGSGSGSAWRLGDFGVARVLDAGGVFPLPPPPPSKHPPSHGVRVLRLAGFLRRTGASLAQTFVGTPVYMSPELFRGLWCGQFEHPNEAQTVP